MTDKPRTKMAWDDNGKIIQIKADQALVPTFHLRWLTSYRDEPTLQQAFMVGCTRIWLHLPEVERKS